jgi:hypothetical protein
VSQSGPPVIAGISDLALLGSGGFADVYKGRQERLGRPVAVKVFKVALIEADAADQFARECQALGRLDDPSILRVFSADVLPDGRPYLVTERCDTSLLRLLTQRGGALPVAEAAEYGCELATALMVAHSAHVLHGDVTPQNVLLRRTGAVVLADFGLAVLHDYRGNTATGFNPAHAAPEVLENAGAITRQTDVYGLGSTLHMLLAGDSPFAARPGESERDRSLRILTQPPPRLGRPDVPPALADLVAGMLEKDPARRPTLEVVADRLAAVRDTAAVAGGLSVGPGPRQGTPAPGAPAPPPRYDPPPGLPPVVLPPAAPPPPLFPDATRGRVGSLPEYAPPPGGAGGHVEPTRVRAGMADVAAPPSRRPRWWVPVAVVAGVAVLAAAAVVVVLVVRGRTTPDPAVAAPATNGPPTTAEPTTAPAGTGIELAAPRDEGTSVVLHWVGPPGLEYNVVIAEEGGTEPRNMLTRQATDATVPVDPAAPYCFRVQGTDGRTDVVQSNVRAIRGAVCRFQ